MKPLLPISLCMLMTACGEPPQVSSTSAATYTPPDESIAPEQVHVENMMISEMLAPDPGDASRGAEIMTTRKLGNCVACHKVNALEEQAPFHGEVGPSLDGAGARWQEAQLRALIVNPKTYFPQTVMPAYYRVDGLNRVREDVAGQPILTAQQVEDVIAFLKTLK